jgi:lipoate-protein ligase A
MEWGEPFFEALDLWIDETPRPGAWNMAVDQAWLEWGERPLLRAYGWEEATVTIGYAQNLSKLAGALPGWPVVRRWTGGGVVFHQADATYTMMVPAADAWAETRPVESYRRIHGSLAAMLSARGYAGCRLAELADVKDLPFCFEAPALHDVIRGAMKVAGAGQRRGKLGLLHQGSVQQVTVGAEFWRDWARQLAVQVNEVAVLPEPVARRAAELTEKRYGLPGWLESRDDCLE